MTSEMVERVAFAMFPHCWAANMEDARRPNGLARDREDAREKARAAIIAMREPTKAMVDHADYVTPSDSDNLQCPDFYRAMIDAALALGPTP